ncbi:DUF2471 family protein [Pararobbsia alpina]|uniref:DUF2471 domain-containing protein n=1 Tax=Pararobbsia alpina TaxID=621374 RepID=A0A6S7BMK9_9BURK|nr:DUF2471 family protein [Pararobbsia alpina]CAB3805999.1 hypothetical protein LMG28138_05746 [Pararobbsia alpina]
MVRGFDAAVEAVEAVEEVVPCVVQRHRSAGVLTWRLMRTVEAEVLSALASTGRHSPQTLGMLRAPDALGYPQGDSPVSFEGHDFSPVIFGPIDDAWNRLN